MRSAASHFFFFLAVCSLPYLFGHWRAGIGLSASGPLAGIVLWSMLAAIEARVQPSAPKPVIAQDISWRRVGVWNLLAVLPIAAIDARFTPGLFAVGLIVGLSGIALRLWSLITLGEHFTWTAGVIKNHSVVKRGPYRYLRHPNYIGSLIFAAGIALMSESRLAALPVAILGLCIVAAARHETKFLRHHLPGYE